MPTNFVRPTYVGPDFMDLLSPMLVSEFLKIKLWYYPCPKDHSGYGKDVSFDKDVVASEATFGKSHHSKILPWVEDTAALTPAYHEMAVSLHHDSLGNSRYLPMLDMIGSFRSCLSIIRAQSDNFRGGELREMLNEYFPGGPKIFNTGNSFHLVSKQMRSDDAGDFAKLCGQVLTMDIPIFDTRWIGFSLRRNAFMVRVGNMTGTKLHAPYRALSAESEFAQACGVQVSVEGRFGQLVSSEDLG